LTFADASPLTSNQSLWFAAQVGVDVGLRSRSSTANPSYTQHGRLRLGVTPAHRQFRLHAAQSGRCRRSAIRIALTLVNNGDQQHADHTSLAKLFHCFLSW
jgi:hypothetical protein